MTTPHLPDVEQLVERLADTIHNAPVGDDATWQVTGPATAGKSTMLGMLHEELRERGLMPIKASPPAGSLDAGPCAITELASGLKDFGAVNGETAALRDPERSLFEKLSLVRKWIEAKNEHVVVLLDEPAAWPDQSEQTGHFADHARVVVYEFVRDLNCRRVITGDMPEALRAKHRHGIEARSHADAFLGDADAWGGLAPAASDLGEIGGDSLGRFSPLELRLLVAHVAVTSPDAVARMLAERVSRRQLSRSLAQLLAESREHAELYEAWRSLGEIRRPFSEDLLKQMTGDLSARNDELMRRCLLFHRPSGWVLHETLRRDVATPLERLDATRLHELADHYAQESLAAAAAGDGPALVPAMESFYYAARAGIRDTPIGEPFFVDQLNLLGKTLSYHHRDYGGAAEVFSRAVEIDETDDYAQHYLAYNLDRLGRDPDRVEAHYRRAIELNGRHPWWRARLVNFLIVRGRTGDAELEWDDALDAVGPRDESAGVGTYERLHGWVATTLLRRGLLTFAERVLEDVPPEARQRSAAISALIPRLRALQLAERDGAFVPSEYLRAEWWKDGPFLLQERLGDDDRLQLRRWLAGRVERLDANEVELRVKDIDVTEAGDIRTATTRMSRELFSQLNRDRQDRVRPGAFVEVGLYSDESGESPQRTIRIHPMRRWVDEAIPGPVAGDRYLSAKGAD